MKEFITANNNKLRYRVTLFILFLCLSGAAFADNPVNGAVASAHPAATQAGIDILKAGGNAFDAAVAVSAAIAVVEPYGSGLGGGGFWLLHRAADGKDVMVDGRERAPLAAHRDLYLDDQGEVIEGASINGPLAAAIPGVPAAMAYLAKTYGRLPLSRDLAPAIRLAREGFKVDEHYRRYAGMRLETLRKDPEAARNFLVNNAVPPSGYLLKQPDLAKTLESIAKDGAKDFYTGVLARRLAEGVKKAGGIWSQQDLREYRVVERKPVVSEYDGMRIVSAALPSSGGIVMAEIFNQLAQFDLPAMSKLDRDHVIIEAMRRGYRDRAEYLGDTDFVDVPVEKLTSAEYARALAKSIDMEEATPSSALRPVAQPDGNGNNTTHFSILDKDGNRVAATLSINYLFGACFVVPGTGFLLNDEMDDFAAKPGVPNAYGLVGTEANAIAPGKRPLSSMSPTFLEKGDRVAILGTPGGSRIISMVMLAALKFAEDAGADADALIKVPRFHHQYRPDVVFFEREAFTTDEEQELNLQGYQTKQQTSPYGDTVSYYGNMQAVVWDKKKQRVSAASDFRGIGQAQLY